MIGQFFPAANHITYSLSLLCYKGTHNVIFKTQPSLFRCFFDFHLIGYTLQRQENGHSYDPQTKPSSRRPACGNIRAYLPHLELISMPLGEVLYESGGQLQYVYFPTTAIVSLHYVLENGASAEIAGVGNEGVLGISLFHGRQYHTQPGHRADCGLRLPTERAVDDGGIQSRWADDAFDAALHPGINDTDIANCGLQSASFDRAATVSLAVVNP